MKLKTDIIKNLTALSVASHDKRKSALINILNENAIHFIRQTENTNGRLVEIL